MNTLTAISPVDGRYSSKTKQLGEYFSEHALIKYRVLVELNYLKALIDNKIGKMKYFPIEKINNLLESMEDYSLEDSQSIKDIEKITNHDVKAVEYFIKSRFDNLELEEYKEFIHFGLTSQDINNTALPLMIKEALENEVIPDITSVVKLIRFQAEQYKSVAMLARTHGQPASPTTVGKEMMVYVERLENQLDILKNLPIKAKFGGATGNFNAHKVTFPDTDWRAFGNQFVADYLGLERSQYTTQIAHYDHLAAIFHALARINTIFIDYSRDIWTYISMEYFKQKVIANEVGSSAMPHKVNPIDFENAEGNLGIANALYQHLAEKLPISRLQRDLTDSTVIRNVGVPMAHTMIAMTSIKKGINKLLLNEEKIHRDLGENWAVVAEGIQNILRRESYPKPYEALKDLTRGKAHITEEDIKQFIEQLNVGEDIKKELKSITPFNYIGYTL